MTKKKILSRCLVVDASIAEAAGTTEPRNPIPSSCREFLMAVRRICHRVAWSEAITGEWEKHKRGFAAQWLVSMRNIGKLRTVRDESLPELREAIQEHSKDPHVVEKMFKDVHLFEAALATDMRVASWDENARGHFSRLAASVHLLRPIMWVNPITEGELAIKWLEEGAPVKPSRRLKRK